MYWASSAMTRCALGPGSGVMIFGVESGDIEADSLRQGQRGPIVHGAGAPAHVTLPGVRARFPATSGFFFPAECPADFGAGWAKIHIDDTAVRSFRRKEPLGLSQIASKDRRRKPLGHGIVHPYGFLKIGVFDHVKYRREGFTLDQIRLLRHFGNGRLDVI